MKVNYDQPLEQYLIECRDNSSKWNRFVMNISISFLIEARKNWETAYWKCHAKKLGYDEKNFKTKTETDIQIPKDGVY